MFIKKIYIYLFLGISAALIIFLLYLLQNTTLPEDSKLSTKNLLTNKDVNTNIEPSGVNPDAVYTDDGEPVSGAKNELPEDVARKFYIWYASHPSPIKSGDYKKRTDITQDFKSTIGIFNERGINPGYDHVFCSQTILTKNFRLEVPMFNYEKTLALIMFKDDKSGDNLFQIKLQKVEEVWVIDDIWCPY